MKKMHFCTTFLGDVPRKRYEIANFAFNSLILLEIEKKRIWIANAMVLGHTNNWAIIVDSSKFWHNYRHVSSVLVRTFLLKEFLLKKSTTFLNSKFPRKTWRIFQIFLVNFWKCDIYINWLFYSIFSGSVSFCEAARHSRQQHHSDDRRAGALQREESQTRWANLILFYSKSLKGIKRHHIRTWGYNYLWFAFELVRIQKYWIFEGPS